MTVVNPIYEIMCLLDDANIPGDSVLEQVQALLAENIRLNNERERMLARPNAERVREMLDADPCDLLHLLADDALDRGAEGEALGWRWLAQNRKQPAREKEKGEWRWGWLSESAVFSMSVSLPLSLFDLVCERLDERYGGSAPTCRAALEAVVAAFAAGWREPKGSARA